MRRNSWKGFIVLWNQSIINCIDKKITIDIKNKLKIIIPLVTNVTIDKSDHVKKVNVVLPARSKQFVLLDCKIKDSNIIVESKELLEGVYLANSLTYVKKKKYLSAY